MTDHDYPFTELLEVRQPFWRPLFLAIIGGLSGGILGAFMTLYVLGK
jgi:hypothetical protein